MVFRASPGCRNHIEYFLVMDGHQLLVFDRTKLRIISDFLLFTDLSTTICEKHHVLIFSGVWCMLIDFQVVVVLMFLDNTI